MTRTSARYLEVEGQFVMVIPVRTGFASHQPVRHALPDRTNQA